ncbi:MAG TPA: sulfatase-like hydrolase/transferase [Bryobacteraceae bacterium]|nr:sulfatase-like hydrolase/transferase [Bryobacteraceae bacterium]
MPLNRREFLAGAAVAAPAIAKPKRAASRPNIVVIVADDLAAWMLGCYGNKEIRTPNIDLLARTGTRFANNFVCTPICSASRATLFTGRTPRQHGIHDFLTNKPIEKPPQGQMAPPASFDREVMISDLLAGQGYNCGYVGKWHMGNDATPQHGYKSWYTMAGGANTNPRISRNGALTEEQGYTAELFTRAAVDFIGQQKAQQPFFLTVSHFNPHVPYDGHPQKYYDMYAQTRFETIGWEPPAANALREKEYLKDIVGNIRRCAAAVTALDDQIPPILKKLDESGLRENTLVLFTGDNGFLLGRHGLWSKGHASDPINMYDEVVSTPMIWNWLGKTPPEAVRPELVSFYDVLPTLCDAADVPVPADRRLCGRSYLPLALGQALPKEQVWRNLVFGHFRNTEMARDARYKVVLRNDGSGPNELFDTREDPRERVNQYENSAFVTVRERLTRELAAWRKQTSSS